MCFAPLSSCQGIGHAFSRILGVKVGVGFILSTAEEGSRENDTPEKTDKGSGTRSCHVKSMKRTKRAAVEVHSTQDQSFICHQHHVKRIVGDGGIEYHTALFE